MSEHRWESKGTSDRGATKKVTKVNPIRRPVIKLDGGVAERRERRGKKSDEYSRRQQTNKQATVYLTDD